MVAWRALFLVVPLSLACSPVERNFGTSSGTASHMGGSASTSTSSHQGGAGGMGAGSSTGGNGSGGGLTEAQACSQYAAKLCAKNETCAPDVLTYTYGDVATCEKRLAIFCSIIDGAPKTAWTPKQFVDCADALTAEACPDYLLSPFSGGPPVCHPKSGKVANGGSCIDSGQCNSTYCKHGGSTACGVCTVLAVAGDPCNTLFDCKSGLTCAGPMGMATCTTPLVAGQMCAGDGDCGLGTTCVGHTCTKPLNVGDGCSAATGVCDPLQGLYCNTNSMTCARAFYSAPGQFCGIYDGGDAGMPGVYGCTASGYCQNAPNGLCVAAAADGATCDPMSGTVCMSPAGCVNGMCAIPNQAMCP